MDRYYQPAFVDVVPGQTTRAELALAGGPALVGRLVAPELAGLRLDLTGGDAYLVLRLPEVPYPAGLANEDRRDWLSRWRLTEEGALYRHRRRGFAHTLNLQPDGSLRIDEIQAGVYELHVRLRGFEELIRAVDVPNATTGRSGAVVDLGALPLKR